MRTWTPPTLPTLPGRGFAPRLFNAATGRFEHPAIEDQRATLYVCGITPYDATHLGHAATYLAFDTMQRAWRDAGIDTEYAQNITDIDDPLLERANATGVDWRALAEEQIGLFRSDMFRLGMLPPHHYVAVTERIDEISFEGPHIPYINVGTPAQDRITVNPGGWIIEGMHVELTAPSGGTGYAWEKDGIPIADDPPRVTGADAQTLVLDPVELGRVMRSGDHDAAIGAEIDDRVAHDLRGRRGSAEVDMDIVRREDLRRRRREAARPETAVPDLSTGQAR